MQSAQRVAHRRCVRSFFDALDAIGKAHECFGLFETRGLDLRRDRGQRALRFVLRSLADFDAFRQEPQGFFDTTRQGIGLILDPHEPGTQRLHIRLGLLWRRDPVWPRPQTPPAPARRVSDASASHRRSALPCSRQREPNRAPREEYPTRSSEEFASYRRFAVFCPKTK